MLRDAKLMNLLLVEDHQEVAGVLFDYFELKGYSVDYANNGEHGLALCGQNYYDVIILDIMLPVMDGLSVCKQLRALGLDTPVLMLTARDLKQDILDGFEHGADDYLVKPFDLNILEARIQALYRRKSGNVATSTLTFSALSLDLQNRTASRDGQKFLLNQTQFIILKTLMLRAPDLATRDELIHAVWSDDAPEGDVLRSHIYQLRSLIDKPFEQHYLRTVPKQGYQLVSD